VRPTVQGEADLAKQHGERVKRAQLVALQDLRGGGFSAFPPNPHPGHTGGERKKEKRQSE
jgi:hypothetical protein